MRPTDPDYPPRLRELADPPDPLHLRGPLDLDAPAVAIVGARRASQHGCDLTRRLAAHLASYGVTIVSGGALGVDAAAHAGALEGGGKTWVVLPTPLDQPSPRTNRLLFDRILEAGGAWLSERETPGHKSAFRDRNRIIAALADLTVVVEARARSGTFYTADAAVRLGRPLWVLPWGLEDPRGEAGRVWARRGASLMNTPDDLLRALQIPKRRRKRRRAAPASALLDSITRAPTSAEALAREHGRPVASILAELLHLELTGHVEARNGRFFPRRGI
ncbi:MAG: DNA-processing protein DprA [Deltaproteobacteria bacterium]